MGSNSHPSLLCRLQGRLCAIPLASVIEMMRPLPVEPLETPVPFVLGLALIRGEPLPVVDLSSLVSGQRGGVGRFVTVRTGERKAALAVEAVEGVRDIDPDSLHALPPLLQNAGHDTLDSLGALDAELLLVLTGARLVPEGAFERAP